MMKRFIALSCLFLAVLSCRRIPLYDADSSVYLNVDIHPSTGINIPEPLSGVVPEEFRIKVDGRIPERLQANFYDVESHRLAYTAFTGPNGGFVDVAPGRYDIVVYSIDSDVTRIDKTSSRGSGYAYSPEAGTRLLLSGDSEASVASKEKYTVIREPDHIYVGRKESVEIPEHSTADETIVIDITATTLVDAYILRVINVDGIENFGAGRAYFTGQVRSRALWDGRNLLEPAAIAAVCLADSGIGEIYSVFNTFGKYPNVSSKLFLNIAVANSSGDSREYVFDVTDQFENPDNTGHVIVVTDRIDIPKPGSGSGGLAPDVDDWDEEHKDIDL